MLDSDASTAKTLTLVAIILQLVFFVIGIFSVIGLSFLLAVKYTVTTSNGSVITNPVPMGAFTSISLIFSVALLFGLLWILLDYFLIYKKLQTERVREAESPSIILGIIQLIFGGLIPGILLIVAYIKIRDSLYRRNSAGS
jgi:1,4-dihydroxy-2-naphthoate octaprenyltransferase